MKQGNVFLALGTNMGNREEHLATAFKYIAEMAVIEKVSSVYHTRAYGNCNQQDFLNIVIRIRTEEKPEILLGKLLEIETRMGRERNQKWESRIIDIDILFWDQLQHTSVTLVIPHYDFINRDFFILPAVEIAPDFIPPGQDMSLSELAKQISSEYIIGKEKWFEPVYSR